MKPLKATLEFHPPERGHTEERDLSPVTIHAFVSGEDDVYAVVEHEGGVLRAIGLHSGRWTLTVKPDAKPEVV